METATGIDIEALLARLDPDQLAAVTAPTGPVAVIAGAGSGKTRVLTTRIAYRIASGTAHASHIVAFTFTRQAATELTTRLRAYGVDRDVVAGTFHSVAYRILRRRWEDRGRRETPTLTADRFGVLVEALDGDRRLAASAVGEIDWARARLVAPADYARAAAGAGRRSSLPMDRVAQVYATYEAHKKRRRLLDFDDLLTECIAELRRPGAAEAVSWWHRHLHVDEFQDINPLQHAFLDALRHGGTDLFLVGDPAQAIYGWNGADPSLLLHIGESALRPVVVRLPTNHRSAPEIVAAADRVLAANRQPAGHVAARPAGGRVLSVAAADETDEAATVVALAGRLRPPGAPWRSVAVLARTNESLRRLAAAFRAAGIPTRTVTRPGGGPPAWIGEARRARDVEALRAWAVDRTWPAEAAGDGPAGGPADSTVGSTVDSTVGSTVDSTADGSADSTADGSAADPDQARAVLRAVRDFEATGGGSGSAFAAWASLQDLDAGPDVDAVDLVTMHAAKGREWPTVIVTGLDTGGFPAPGAPRSPARAEEVRVLYVSLTRAEDRLAVTWASSRGGVRTERTPLLPSLDDLSRSPTADVVAPPPELRRRRAVAAVDPVLAGLTAWRDRAAHAAGVPAQFLFDDATLHRVAAARPEDEAALASVDGVGPLAAHRFGERMLAVIRDHR